jgi:glycerol-3-phosphate dehydrogenase
MRRDLTRMSARRLDLIVIGGGVTGACVARDAAMRGLAVALVEKHDFSHATSAASSKLIHGGLRYLRNLEVGMIRQSLRERRIWERSAPHLVYPLAMVVPVYQRHRDSLRKVRVGLSIYDALAFDRGWLADPDQRLPGHRALSAAEALALQPELSADGLTGAAVYHDCQMFSPERLALECLLSAAGAGASLANYAEVDGFVREGDRVAGVRVRDALTGRTHELRAGLVINAAGPWADRLLGRLSDRPAPKMIRSKGIHVITRAVTGDHALAIVGRDGHVFLLPWRGRTLIGTTDEVYEGEPDDFRVTEADITGLLAHVAAEVPGLGLTRADVLHTYGGLRPLVEDSSATSTYDTSRRSEICDHAREGGPQGLISVLGGKWTTSRALAAAVVDLVGRKLGRKLPACTTDQVPLPGGAIGRFSRFVADAERERPDMDPALLRHLARNYGGRMGEVLHLATDPTSTRPLAEGLQEIGAQVVHAVRAEMAVALEDVVFRRTGLGTLGNPGDRALAATARQMGALLGWGMAERIAQVDRVLDRYATATA